MRSILDKPSRESKRFFSKRRCPMCGKRFSTVPKFTRHVWTSFVARGLSVSWSEAEMLWDRHGRTLIQTDDEGNKVVRIPDGETKEER